MAKSATVKREIASQRRYFRISAPIHIRLPNSNASFATVNWSLGGFCLHNISSNCSPDTVVEIEVLVAFGEFKINFSTRARVVRVDTQKKELAAEFVALEEAHKELLKHFSDSLVTGQMAKVGDTIQRMDVPVSLVSENPDKPASGQTAVPKKSRKTTIFSLGYIAVGCIVAAYGLNTLYINMFKLQVDSAAVVGNENLIRSPISGTIDAVYVNSGDSVERATPLLYIRDDSTLESIDLARLQVSNAESDLQEKMQLLDSQISKVQSYKRFGTDLLRIRKAKTEALEEKLAIAEKRYQRTAQLASQNLYSDDLLDRISEDVISLKSELKVARAEQNIASNAIAEIDNGRFFTDNRLEGQVDELRSAVQAAKTRVELEQQRLSIMENRRARLEINAPVGGQVATLFTSEHQLIEKGAPLLVIERDGEKSIDAYVPANDFEKIRIDQPAKIILAGKSQSLTAYIAHVDRNPVTDHTVTGELTADEQLAPPVKVTLSFEPGNPQVTQLPSGLPVKVLFARQSIGQTLAGLTEFFVPDAVAEEFSTATAVK